MVADAKQERKQTRVKRVYASCNTPHQGGGGAASATGLTSERAAAGAAEARAHTLIISGNFRSSVTNAATSSHDRARFCATAGTATASQRDADPKSGSVWVALAEDHRGQKRAVMEGDEQGDEVEARLRRKTPSAGMDKGGKGRQKAAGQPGTHPLESECARSSGTCCGECYSKPATDNGHKQPTATR